MLLFIIISLSKISGTKIKGNKLVNKSNIFNLAKNSDLKKKTGNIAKKKAESTAEQDKIKKRQIFNLLPR